MLAGRRVGIIDYQAGNLQSIANAFDYLGAQACSIRGGSDVEGCTHLVLPGVGAFGFCAERFEQSGLRPAIEHWACEKGRPLLGICVGMQLFADASEESPEARGLSWIGGQVRLLPGGGEMVRVPHVGWNTVRFEHPYGEFQEGEEADFYFDHSFAYADPVSGVTLGVCEHGIRFTVVVQRANIVGVQFHPEKSQTAGMRFLKGFLAS